MTRKTPSKPTSRRRVSKSWALAESSPAASARDAVTEAVATKGILVRTPVATWRRLKHISADQDKSLQALLHEAIDHIINVHS